MGTAIQSDCPGGVGGRGRDDYPVHVLWGTVLLVSLLRHPTTEACLGELQRNASLRRLIGIESEGGVPKKWNVSRCLDVLGAEPLPRIAYLPGDRGWPRRPKRPAPSPRPARARLGRACLRNRG